MKATDNFNLPYPECDPPLVKDASDIAHVRNLAEAVDTAVTGLVQFANDEFISPDACVVTAAAQAPLVNGEFITFNAVAFDNSPGAVMGTLPKGITIRQSGFYFITGYLSSTGATDGTCVVLNVEGLGNICEEGLASGTASRCPMVGSMIYPLTEGQVVRMAVRNTVGSVSIISGSRLSLVRITGAS